MQKLSAPKAVRPFESTILQPAKLIESNSTFQSKTFIVRINEEDIELNDFCLFRAEVDHFANPDAVTFYLEATLEYAEIGGGKAQHQSAQQPQPAPAQPNQPEESKNPDEDKVIYAPVGQVILKITGWDKGLHEYTPLVYEEDNYGVVDMTLHSVMYDYRYRYLDIQINDIAHINIEEMINCALKENVEAELRKLKSSLEKALKRKEVMQSPIHFLDYLKQNDKGTQADIQKLQTALIEKMKLTHKDLYDRYEQYQARCVTDKIRKEYKHVLSQPPIKLIIPDFISQAQGHPGDDPIVEKQKENEQSVQSLESMAESMLQEVMFIGCQIYQLWHKFLELMKCSPKFITAFLQFDYDARIKDKWDEFVVRSVTKVKSRSTHINDTIIYFDSNLGQKHEAEAAQVRLKQTALQSVVGISKLKVINQLPFP